MAKKEKIEDFGNKIGGARKDLWQSRNLILSDLENMTSIEREKYITKKQVWKAPNYQKMLDDGLSKRVVFYIKTIHDKLPATPYADTEKYQNGYVKFVGEIRDKAMEIKTEDDAKYFWEDTICSYCNRISTWSYEIRKEDTYGCLTNKLFKAAQIRDNFRSIDRQIKEKQFLYTDEEKILADYDIIKYDGSNIKKISENCITMKNGGCTTYLYNVDQYYSNLENWNNDSYFIYNTDTRAIYENNFHSFDEAKDYILENATASEKKSTKKSNRKKKFTPEQLKSIDRNGCDYRNNKNITGDDMLKQFGFYGGEFGNWLNENDRQHNLNYSYDAFKDLAAALNISDEDISLGGKLSIAYGARGHSTALAHFEPDRNVINLTKMKGAGSLAHEWGHALDFFLAQQYQTADYYFTRSYDDLIKPVLIAMMYREKTDIEKQDYREKTISNFELEFSEDLKKAANYYKRDNEEKLLIEDTIEKCLKTSCTQEERNDFIENHNEPLFMKHIHELSERLDSTQIIKYANYYSYELSQINNIQSDSYQFQKIKSDFYTNSQDMDRLYSKDDKGYWSSEIEMFARAFACYVYDKIEPNKSDYLCGHANTAIGTKHNDEVICAYPQGEERKAINAAFDNLFDELRERGIFKANEHNLQKNEFEVSEQAADVPFIGGGSLNGQNDDRMNNICDFVHKNNSTGITITEYIGDYEKVIIPAEIENIKVTAIGENAFANCTNLKEITVSENVAQIEAGAFYYCDNLEKVKLPDELKTIAEDAFYGCSKLSEIELPKECTYDKYTFSDNTIINIKSNDKKIEFTQVNSFYETYGDNAVIVSDELGCKLMSRDNKPMIGIADWAMQKYTSELKEKGYSVVLHSSTASDNLTEANKNDENIKLAHFKNR